MLTPVVLALWAATARPAPALLPKNRPYDVQHYKIDVRLHDDGTFDNDVSIRLKPKRALNEVELDSYNLQIKSAKVDGAAATFSLKGDLAQRTGTLTVKSAKAIAPGKEAVVEITYGGRAASGHEGFFAVKDPDSPDARPYYFTQFEPTSAQRFFPCNDEPSDKATTEVFAIVDQRDHVFSNGKKLLDEEYSEQDQHLRRVHWQQDKAQSTYMVALAIGAFQEVEVSGEVPGVLAVPARLADLAFVAADVTPTAMTAEAQFLGVKFPWDTYSQVAVPGFFWDGRAAASLSLERADAMVMDARNDLYGRPERVEQISRQLAHQWFGASVTLKWWDDSWLNEAVASYLGDKGVAAYFENELALVREAKQTAVRYIRDEDERVARPLVAPVTSWSDVLDHSSETKGSAVLRMLENWVGKDELRKALAAYLKQYPLGNASSEDFFAAIGKATGKERELKGFKESWLHKKGYPVLTPKVDWSGSTLTVTVQQHPQSADEKGPFVFKLPIVFHRDSEPAYTQELTLLCDKATSTAKVDLPAPPEWVNWNKEGVALARIEEGVIAERQWINAARKDPDPVWRLFSQYALLGEMVNPASKTLVRPTDAALDALVDGLGADPSPYVREAVLERIGMSKWNHLPKELGPVILELAKNPRNLPDDAVGLVRVKHAALGALGKIDDAEGHQYVLEGLARKDVDINALSGLAMGAGRMGDSAGLSAARAAVTYQRARSLPYLLAALQGLASASTVDAVPLIADAFHDNAGVDEALRVLIAALEDNQTLRESAEFAALAQQLVLGKDLGDDVKARVIMLLAGVHTPEAREALMAVQAKSDSSRLKAVAGQIR